LNQIRTPGSSGSARAIRFDAISLSARNYGEAFLSNGLYFAKRFVEQGSAKLA
jgi:hypothetical protein